jgi:hypothetical protein
MATAQPFVAFVKSRFKRIGCVRRIKFKKHVRLRTGAPWTRQNVFRGNCYKIGFDELCLFFLGPLVRI